MLNEAADEAIELQISSLGGSVDHALAIHDMLAERGNISSKLTGFIASAATFIALPTTTRISENSFYLIHKVLSWVDEWGMMNEDDIDAVIEKLSKEKKENEKMTLVMAQRYAERAKAKGKSLHDVLELMKQDTWLTASEALEWGFVDEVYTPATQENFIEDMRMVAMVNASNLPPLPTSRSILNFSPKHKPIENNKITFTMKTLNLPHIAALLNVDEIVTDEDQGSYIPEASLIAIEDRITQLTLQADEAETLRTQNSELSQKLSESETRQTELQEENQNLSSGIATLTGTNDALTQQVTELTEQAETDRQSIEDLTAKNKEMIERLTKSPARRAITFASDTDPDKDTNDVDWDTINALPHNQNVN